MRKLLAFLLGLLYSMQSYSQTGQNLEKYWRYRERLRKDFIVVSDQVEQFGTNIPAVELFLTADGQRANLSWGDANSNMSHYLSLLATEYRLLKNHGQSYQETLAELYYAMLALERLDLYSEYSIRYRDNLVVYVDPQADYNGWMIRDDVSQGFWNTYYQRLGFASMDGGYFGSVYTEGPHLMESVSQDNIYHLLEGLSLIYKLVDEESVAGIPCTFINSHIPTKLASQGVKNGSQCNFSLWAQKITNRVVRMMQHPEPEPRMYFYSKRGDAYRCDPNISWVPGLKKLCDINTRWYIKNPVTTKLAEEGSGSDFDLHYFYSYGAARAANWITGEEYHMDGSDSPLHTEVFFNLLRREKDALNPIRAIIKNIKFDDYKISTLAVIGDVGTTETFEVLRRRDATYPYEHFPLMYLVLHEDAHPGIYPAGSTKYVSDKTHYENLLNIAPCSGTRSYDPGVPNDYNDAWSSVSRLVWPEKLLEASGQKVEYSGMDYMLLHNLYCLVYGSDFRKLTVMVDANTSQVNTFETGVNIVSSQTITKDNTVYLASHSIRLVPSFQATSGIRFRASLESGVPDYTGYSQTNSCTPTSSSSSRLAYVNRTAVSNGFTELEKGITRTGVASEGVSAIYTQTVVQSQLPEILVYPNPARGVISIQGLDSQKPVTVQISNLVGRKVKEIRGKAWQQLDISDLASGTYVVKIVQENATVYKKIVLEK